MIDLWMDFNKGTSLGGFIIEAKYNKTDRRAFALRSAYGGTDMEIKDSNGAALAHITEEYHLIGKSHWRIDFVDGQPPVLLTPQGRFSSKWTVKFNHNVEWDVGSGQDHKVMFGSAEVGLVKQFRYSEGPSRILVEEEDDVLTLVGFAGALYMQRSRRLYGLARSGSVYTVSIPPGMSADC